MRIIIKEGERGYGIVTLIFMEAYLPSLLLLISYVILIKHNLKISENGGYEVIL